MDEETFAKTPDDVLKFCAKKRMKNFKENSVGKPLFPFIFDAIDLLLSETDYA